MNVSFDLDKCNGTEATKFFNQRSQQQATVKPVDCGNYLETDFSSLTGATTSALDSYETSAPCSKSTSETTQTSNIVKTTSAASTENSTSSYSKPSSTSDQVIKGS